MSLMSGKTLGPIPEFRWRVSGLLAVGSALTDGRQSTWLAEMGFTDVYDFRLVGEAKFSALSKEVKQDLEKHGLDVVELQIGENYWRALAEDGQVRPEIEEIFQRMVNDIKHGGMGVLFFSSPDAGKLATVMAERFVVWYQERHLLPPAK